MECCKDEDFCNMQLVPQLMPKPQGKIKLANYISQLLLLIIVVHTSLLVKTVPANPLASCLIFNSINPYLCKIFFYSYTGC